MKMGLDVTDQVSFYFPDDETLPLTKCVCGKIFALWEFVISMYREHPTVCPNCGCWLYFKQEIRVFEVKPK
jgi:hypothetical protein